MSKQKKYTPLYLNADHEEWSSVTPIKILASEKVQKEFELSDMRPSWLLYDAKYRKDAGIEDDDFLVIGPCLFEVAGLLSTQRIFEEVIEAMKLQAIEYPSDKECERYLQAIEEIEVADISDRIENYLSDAMSDMIHNMATAMLNKITEQY